MRYEIMLSPEARDDILALRVDLRALVRDSLEKHLRFQPTKTSKSRIKRLRGLSRPQFRLRVDDIRIFNDVTGQTVEVLAIIPKPELDQWLAREGR